MVKGHLRRRMDESAYKLAIAVEDAGVPVEAAFWRREADERWFLYLASPEVDGLGEAAVLRTIRERQSATGHGKGLFTLSDVRAIGMGDNTLLDVRLRHYAPRGEGICFTGDTLVLWARRQAAKPVLDCLLECEVSVDEGCEFSFSPLSMQAMRFQVTPPASHPARRNLPQGREFSWKAHLEFPALGEWAVSGEGTIGRLDRGGIELSVQGESVIVDWGRGRGRVAKEPLLSVLAAFGREYQAALDRVRSEPG